MFHAPATSVSSGSLAEAGVASGVRRIEAVTGDAALTHMAGMSQAMQSVCGALKATPETASGKVEALRAELRDLEKESARLRQKLATSTGWRLDAGRGRGRGHQGARRPN